MFFLRRDILKWTTVPEKEVLRLLPAMITRRYHELLGTKRRRKKIPRNKPKTQ